MSVIYSTRIESERVLFSVLFNKYLMVVKVY